MPTVQSDKITWLSKVEGKGGGKELLAINPRILRDRMKRLGVPFVIRVKG